MTIQPALSVSPRAGVLMVWCNRPVNPRRSPEWGTLDEVRVLARGYHYLCPLDYAELDIRELSDAKDPRVVVEAMPEMSHTLVPSHAEGTEVSACP